MTDTEVHISNNADGTPYGARNATRPVRSPAKGEIMSKMSKTEFMELVKSLSEEWSNDACRGYLILACKKLNYSKKQTQELLDAMKIAFDWTSVKEAEEIYCKF